MDDNFKNEILTQKTRFLRARTTIIFMSILSVINVLLTVATQGNSKSLMPFSCAISTYAPAFGTILYKNNGNIVYYIIGIIIAVFIIAYLTLCYFKSKKNIEYLISAFAIIIVDTLTLLALLFSGNTIAEIIDFSNVFTNIIIHFLILWYIFAGIKAYKLLGDLNRISDTKIYDECNPYQDSQSSNIDIIDVDVDGNINESYQESETLLSGIIDNHDIIISVCGNYIELIIDNTAYDSVNFIHNPEFELDSIIDGVNINFQYKRTYTSETAFLYAADKLLDSYYKDNF